MASAALLGAALPSSSSPWSPPLSFPWRFPFSGTTKTLGHVQPSYGPSPASYNSDLTSQPRKQLGLCRKRETLDPIKPPYRPCLRPSRCLPSSPPSAAAPAAISPFSDLLDYICTSPLLAKAGIEPDSVAASIDEWLELGLRLSRYLGFRELQLTESQKSRIYRYYLPVFFWCREQLLRRQKELSKNREGVSVAPMLVGISAPQGSGKTTLVYALENLFNSVGRRAVSISIDDFYLTAEEQGKLAAEYSNNALLQFRGNAGSHDLSLGTKTLKELQDLTSKGKTVKVPRYDKSAYGGRGDRATPSSWPSVEGPLEVILLEGWMLGFEPIEPSAAAVVDPQLKVVNEKLAAYRSAWEDLIDSWIIIKVGDPEWVYTWRLQAEIAMKADGKPGMTDEQISDFVARYMPAYKAYLPGLYKNRPKGAKPDCTFLFEINAERNPIE